MKCNRHRAPGMVDVQHQMCTTSGCGKHALFGHPGRARECCASHKRDGMVDLAHNSLMCRADGCGKRANFGAPEGRPEYCAAHKQPDMVDVTHHSCAQPGCMSRGAYTYLDQDVGMFCKAHARAGMVYKDNRQCGHGGCVRRPAFGVPGGVAVRCKEHMDPGMVDVVTGSYCSAEGCALRGSFVGADGLRYCSEHGGADKKSADSRKCRHEGCGSRPVYGTVGLRAVCCSKHKSPDMVDVVHAMCTSTGCKVRAAYAEPGTTVKKFCKKHAPADWVTTDKKARCTHEGCAKIASYGLEVAKKATRCAQHKDAGMVDVAHRTCAHAGCRKKPSFAASAGGKAQYCKDHADVSMTNVTTKQCYFDGCTKRAFSGLPGQSPTSCAEHRTPGMIGWPLRKCECGAAAVYGTHEPTHCEQHHDPRAHTDLVHRQCGVCGLVDVVDAQSRCARCSDYLQRSLHTVKQRDVRAMLQATDLPPCEQYDKQVDGGFCGPERPDFVWTTPTHVVVLEVDENQHRHIAAECEAVRMKNVTSSFGMPVLWLRYNPDAFRGEWPQLTRAARHDALVQAIRDALASAPASAADFCRVTYLYYDGQGRGGAFPVERLQIV